MNFRLVPYKTYCQHMGGILGECGPMQVFEAGLESYDSAAPWEGACEDDASGGGCDSAGLDMAQISSSDAYSADIAMEHILSC